MAPLDKNDHSFNHYFMSSKQQVVLTALCHVFSLVKIISKFDNNDCTRVRSMFYNCIAQHVATCCAIQHVFLLRFYKDCHWILYAEQLQNPTFYNQFVCDYQWNTFQCQSFLCSLIVCAVIRCWRWLKTFGRCSLVTWMTWPGWILWPRKRLRRRYLTTEPIKCSWLCYTLFFKTCDD